MKVLFLTTWYPSKNNPTTGIFIKEHAVAAQLNGADVYVLNFNISTSKNAFNINYLDFIDEKGINTFTIEIRSKFYKLIYISPFLLYKISYYFYNKFIKEKFEPEIIHSHVIFPAGIIGDNFSKKLKLPHIISEHWSEIKVYIKRNIFSNNGINAYKNAAVVLPVSNYLKNKLKFLLGNKIDLEIIPNIVDNSIFHYLPKKLNSRKIKFIAIANWHKRYPYFKRPDLLFYALAEVQKHIEQEVEFELIGGGNWITELIELAKHLNLNVIFSLQQDKNYIAQQFSNTNFLLHASEKETFCIVIAEALKTGTPVIASNVDAIPELINNNNGIVCENDVKSWTKAILAAIGNNYEYENIANEVKDKFNYRSVGKKLVDIYDQLIT